MEEVISMDTWEKLLADCENCTACALHETRTNCVFGTGNENADILFVGAEGRMEMEKVPAAGYEIVGLPISGLKRSLSLSNFAVIYKVIKSVSMAKKRLLICILHWLLS